MPYELAGLSIPDQDIDIKFIRSAGPGGQNVNKLATAAQLRFGFMRCAALLPAVRNRLLAMAGQRLAGGDEILILAREHRTQEQNRTAALQRLADLLMRAQHVPKPRKPTKPGRAARERRLNSKARDSARKRLRGRVSRTD